MTQLGLAQLIRGVDVPCALNPFNAKNAGIRSLGMPATPEKVWRTMHTARAA